MLRVLAEKAQSVVLSPPRTPRAMDIAELRELAIEELGADRVFVAESLDDAIDQAVTLVEADHVYGGGVVLITGSIVLVGEAIGLLGGAA